MVLTIFVRLLSALKASLVVSRDLKAPKLKRAEVRIALGGRRQGVVAGDYIVSLCGADSEIGLSWRLLEKKVHDVCAFRE